MLTQEAQCIYSTKFSPKFARERVHSDRLKPNKAVMILRELHGTNSGVSSDL